MYFINDKHEENYHKLAETALFDKAYRSAAYLLSIPMVYRPDMTDFFNAEDGFAVDEFLAMTRFSMGQQDVIKMASTLFNGYLKIDLFQAMNRLDDPHYAALVQAMEIRRPGKEWSINVKPRETEQLEKQDKEWISIVYDHNGCNCSKKGE